MRNWFRSGGFLRRVSPPGISDIATEKEAVRQSRKRLVALLFLFDALLITATLLSFQEAELIEREFILQETREVVEVIYQEQVITQTTVITEIIPYGSVP